MDSYGAPGSQAGPSRSSGMNRNPVLALNDASLHANDIDAAGFAAGNPSATSPLAQSFQRSRTGSFGPDQLDGMDRRGSAGYLEDTGMRRTTSTTSLGSQAGTPSRNNTLRKQRSLSRKTSLKRSSSKRSARAGSIGGITYNDTSGVDRNNVFSTPVPTSGSPTEILANRFQIWRKVLKDLIAYFREVQSSYENRSKALSKVYNSISNIAPPPIFMKEGGLNDAHTILRDYHKQAVSENQRSRDVLSDVIAQLGSLRSDLAQKIKEIKSLSGDFKNTVEKEKENTRKAVNALQEALAAVDTGSHATNGKDDPYVYRMSVDRQVERQIDEENYLHRAYLNLEGSGRELESIVAGEIQKAYNAYASILKKDADEAYDNVEKLRSGPVSIPKDLEWTEFVEHDPNFVSSKVPLRRVEDLEYPGKFHPAAAEIRSGMLERKSKYLKSYTPGWYVLSPTHLHEFKSADGLYTQSPIMSLYLADQKLGARSQPDSSSHKFMLKGPRTGNLRRDHSLVLRAESYDTMLAWYDDIKSLTEKTGEDRNNFVRTHARSLSRNSTGSASSLEEDEADKIPYSGSTSLINGGRAGSQVDVQQRPQPGGRFPSDVQDRSNLPDRGSSDSSIEHDLTTAAGEYQVPQTTQSIGDLHMQRYMDQAKDDGPSDGPPVWRHQGAHHEPATISQPQPHSASSAHASWVGEPTPDSEHETPSIATGLAATMAARHGKDHLGTHPSTVNPQPVEALPAAASSGDAKAPIETTHNPQPQLAQESSVPIRGTTEESLPAGVVMASPSDDPAHVSKPVAQGQLAEFEDVHPLLRRATDSTVSHFHVPGEYPKNLAQ